MAEQSDLIVYIMRHGYAEAGNQRGDQYRNLTVEGRKLVRQTAQKMADEGFVPQILFHSPYVRTTQTAQGMAEVLDLVPQPLRALGSGGRLGTVLSRLQGLEESTLLVGHIPMVSELCFEITGTSVAFNPGNCTAIKLEDVTQLKGSVIKVF